MDAVPENDLKEKLSGIVADVGAIVTCRDSSSLEMILRMNRQYKEQFILCMLTETPKDSATIHVSSTSANIFVRDVDRLECDIQTWLNPLDVKSRGADQAKRARDRESSDSGLDSSDDST